jgi:hypothetical protein
MCFANMRRLTASADPPKRGVHMRRGGVPKRVMYAQWDSGLLRPQLRPRSTAVLLPSPSLSPSHSGAVQRQKRNVRGGTWARPKRGVRLCLLRQRREERGIHWASTVACIACTCRRAFPPRLRDSVPVARWRRPVPPVALFAHSCESRQRALSISPQLDARQLRRRLHPSDGLCKLCRVCVTGRLGRCRLRVFRDGIGRRQGDAHASRVPNM